VKEASLDAGEGSLDDLALSEGSARTIERLLEALLVQ